MSTNIEYQFHNLTGRIDDLRPGLPAGGDVAEKGRAAAGYLGALKHMVRSWAGLALLVSIGVICIPLLVYSVALLAVIVFRAIG